MNAGVVAFEPLESVPALEQRDQRSVRPLENLDRRLACEQPCTVGLGGADERVRQGIYDDGRAELALEAVGGDVELECAADGEHRRLIAEVTFTQNLDNPFLLELSEATAELLVSSGVAAADACEPLGRERRDRREPHRLSGIQGAYLLHDRKLERLTTDMTVAVETAQETGIPHGEIAKFPGAALLTSAVGRQVIKIETVTRRLGGGDRLLFCSDGLHHQIADDDIGRILLESSDAETACVRLITAANDAGGRDNITAVLVDVFSPSRKRC